MTFCLHGLKIRFVKKTAEVIGLDEILREMEKLPMPI